MALCRFDLGTGDSRRTLLNLLTVKYQKNLCVNAKVWRWVSGAGWQITGHGTPAGGQRPIAAEDLDWYFV